MDESDEEPDQATSPGGNGSGRGSLPGSKPAQRSHAQGSEAAAAAEQHRAAAPVRRGKGSVPAPAKVQPQGSNRLERDLRDEIDSW